MWIEEAPPAPRCSPHIQMLMGAPVIPPQCRRGHFPSAHHGIRPSTGGASPLAPTQLWQPWEEGRRGGQDLFSQP